MTYFAKLWYHVSTCLYVCVRCGLILKDFKLFQAAHAGHIRPGTLNWMQKTTTANIRHTITVFDAFDGLKFATWCPKLVPLTTWRSLSGPISWWILDTVPTDICLAVMEYQCRWHGGWQDGHVMFSLYCFAFLFFSGLSKRHDVAPCTQPPKPPSQERFWELNSIGWGMFLPWVSQLVTLWLWTSSILTLATCFMYREASVLGLESWREKQRGALMSMLHPCWTPACHYPSAWQAEAVSNYGYMRRQKGEANSALVKVPLSLTFPCLTVCWSWHFPRQQEQTSCRWLLIAITGGASWVRALAGNLDVAMDG